MLRIALGAFKPMAEDEKYQTTGLERDLDLPGYLCDGQPRWWRRCFKCLALCKTKPDCIDYSNKRSDVPYSNLGYSSSELTRHRIPS